MSFRPTLSSSSLVAALIFSSALCTAGTGAGSGGGGTGIQLKDGTVVLARTVAIGKPTELSPPVRDALMDVSAILSKHYDSHGFIEKDVLGKEIEYRFVDDEDFATILSIQTQCNRIEKYAPLPEGATLLGPIACTNGIVTWFKKSVLPHMSLGQFVKMVIHERLHGRDIKGPHDLLDDITDGLELALSVYQTQKNAVSGENLPYLSSDQIETLEVAGQRLYQLGIGPEANPEFVSTEHGGGRIDRHVQLTATSYVGILSKVEGCVQMDDGATILDSELRFPNEEERCSHLGQRTFIARSEMSVRTSSLAEESTIVDSIISGRVELSRESHIEKSHSSATLRLGESSRVVASRLAGTITTQDQVRILKSDLNLSEEASLSTGSVVQDSDINSGLLAMSAKATIRHSRLRHVRLKMEGNSRLENLYDPFETESDPGVENPGLFKGCPTAIVEIIIAPGTHIANVSNHDEPNVEHLSGTSVGTTIYNVHYAEWHCENSYNPVTFSGDFDFGGEAICPNPDRRFVELKHGMNYSDIGTMRKGCSRGF